MVTMGDPDLASLLMDEERLVFGQFDFRVAWELGSAMRIQAEHDELPIVISIRRGEQRLFHTALPGSAADNDSWIDRKSAVVNRFGHSSYYVGCLYRSKGRDFDVDARLDVNLFAAHGGAFPLTLRGSGPIGVVAVSGLPQVEDHRFVVEALERFLAATVR
jgi:uncharacterized protein (UPF0303 family)